MDELTFGSDNGMDEHVVKHDQMIGSVVQIGKIVTPEKNDPKPPASTPSVLVHIGGERAGTFTRNWMPWVTSRAGYDSEWWMPEENEQVVVAAPSGNLALGIIIGTVYRGEWLSLKAGENNKSKPKVGEKTPAEKERHIHRRVYQDGSEVSFDRKKHLFSMIVKAKPDSPKPAVKLTISVKEKKGEISVTCGEEEKDQTKIELKSGSVQFKSSKDLSLIVGDSVIEMKTDKIVLKSKELELDAGTKLTINDSAVDVS